MKAAFAYWGTRIAPVFDTAQQIRVIDVEANRIVAQTNEILDDQMPARRAFRLAELGIGALVDRLPR